MLSAISSTWKKLRPKKQKVKRAITFDRATTLKDSRERAKKNTYKMSIIALSAKLSAIDGTTNKKEIENITKIFDIKREGGDAIEALFIAALHDRLPPEHYAERITLFFPNKKELYKEVLNRLFKFAAIDSPVNTDEIIFLKKIANVFAISEDDFANKVADSIKIDSKDKYKILEVTKGVTPEALQRKYREKIRLYHPDKLESLKLPQHIIALANKRVDLLTNSYNSLKKQKNF